jgi:hypothetical protein
MNPASAGDAIVTGREFFYDLHAWRAFWS